MHSSQPLRQRASHMPYAFEIPVCCWLLAAGCWLLTAGCWLLLAADC
jgi:hypothetical protein